MSFPYMAALSWRAVGTQYAAVRALHTGVLGMTEDGSLYRLCKAGAAITSSLAAAINYNNYVSGFAGGVLEASLHAVITVGDVSAQIHDTNARAANYYKDGYMVSPDGTLDCIRHIWKSDAGSASVIKVYVSAPFTVAQTTNTVQLYPNPWGNVRSPGSYLAGSEHFCCIPPAPIADGYYFWGQVKGPHWAWIYGTWPGVVSGDRDVVFWQDGSIQMADLGINANLSLQRAGYAMISGNYGDALIYLQIE